MASSKYFASYRNAYGNSHELKEFDKLDDVLALVKRADDEFQGIRQLVVIYGEQLEFEPCEIVKSYRIKESS